MARWVVHEGADLGKVLAEIRYDRGLTQEQMADHLGISRSWLAKIERGRTTSMVDLLVRLLRWLGATIVVEFHSAHLDGAGGPAISE